MGYELSIGPKKSIVLPKSWSARMLSSRICMPHIMAADHVRKSEAFEWAEGIVGNVNDEGD